MTLISTISGLCFGYDTAVVSGASLYFEDDFPGISNEEKETVVSLAILGAALGALSTGSIADRFGRRLTFWITTAIICVLMTAKTFLLDYYTLYVILKIIASACYMSTYQLPATLITEVANPSYRSWTLLFTTITW